MAKIYPQTSTSSSSSSSSSSSYEKETFTIWLKSIVYGNGCTVYNSDGHIVYRVDNYDSKSSDEVHLMDLRGNVLCSILRKKFQFGCWDGYNCDSHKMKNEKPWFQVKKNRKLLKGDSDYQVTVRLNEDQIKLYNIKGEPSKQAFRLFDSEQRIVAEVEQKQSLGVVLGNDVLSLVVEPDVDHSLIISLVAFYGLVSHNM